MDNIAQEKITGSALAHSARVVHSIEKSNRSRQKVTKKGEAALLHLENFPT